MKESGRSNSRELPSRDLRVAFRALVSTRVISALIIWIDFTLLFSLLSYQWNASVSCVGLTAGLYGLPGLFLGPVIGRLADRTDPLRLLRASYSLRAFASIGLILAPSFWCFIACVLAQGISNLAVMPSEQVLIRRALTVDWMVMHARVTGSVDQLAKISAPLLGAALAHGLGARVGFGFSAALALPAIYCLRAMGRLPALRWQGARFEPCAARRLSPLIEILRHDHAYRVAFIATLLQTVVLGLYDPLLALFLKSLGMPVEMFGIIVAATACGGVVAALALRKVPEIHGAAYTEMLLAAFGLTVLIPGLLTFSCCRPPLAALLVLWFGNGFCYGSTAIRFAVTQQARCPAHSLGCVASTARSLQLAALVLGPMLGSTLATLLGIPAVLMLAGGSAVFAGACLYLRRRPRRQGPAPSV